MVLEHPSVARPTRVKGGCAVAWLLNMAKVVKSKRTDGKDRFINVNGYMQISNCAINRSIQRFYSNLQLMV